MNKFRVYVHIAPSNKIYIGITSSKKPENRWGMNGTGYKGNTYFYRAIQKYGWDNFKHIILMENLSKEMACECEKYLIAKYRSNEIDYGYNLTAGGEGVLGYKFSKEHCEKQSKRMLGHTISSETRKKIGDANRIALKGKKLPEEVKRKISIAKSGENNYWYRKKKPRDVVERMRQKQLGNKYHLGCKATEEQRKRMSDAHKGQHNSPESIKLGVINRKKFYAEHPEKELERREKISKAKLGKKRGPWTDDERKAHMEAIERRRKEKLQNTTT